MCNSLKIRPTRFFCGEENFSRGCFASTGYGPVDFYTSQKNNRFLEYFTRILQFLCSLVKLDLANQGLRQPVQPHTLNAQLLVFDETSAQLHFAVANCSDVGMSVFHSPVLKCSLMFLQLLTAVS